MKTKLNPFIIKAVIPYCIICVMLIGQVQALGVTLNYNNKQDTTSGLVGEQASRMQDDGISFPTSNSAYLKGLTLLTEILGPNLPNVTLSPSFSADITEYSAKLDSALNGKSISLIAATADLDSKIKVTVNGNNVKEGKVGKYDILVKSESPSYVLVTVTSKDGRIKTYKIHLTVGQNVDLKSLTISNGILGPKLSNVTLSPSFTPNITEYSAKLDSALDGKSISLRAITADFRSKITTTVDGDDVRGERAGTYEIRLKSQTYVEVTVTSMDGKTTQTYKINITLGQNVDLKSLALSNGKLSPNLSSGTLSPSFSADITEYSAKLDSALDGKSISLRAATAELGSGITVAVNGNDVQKVRDGIYEIGLKSKSQTYVEVTVTSRDGKTSKTYKISITVGQNVDLKSLTLLDGSLRKNFSEGILSPSFSADITEYSAKLDSELNVKTASLIAVTADSRSKITVIVNGDNQGERVGTQHISLNSESPSFVLVTVTSGDRRIEKTYKINITVGQKVDLKSLTLSNGTLSPSFSSDIMEYSVELDSALSGSYIYIAPSVAASDSTITVTVNGNDARSEKGGFYRVPVDMKSQTNVDIKLASKITKVTKTYKVTILTTIQNADLNNIYLSEGSLSPSFSSEITSYNVSLDSVFEKKNIYMNFSTVDSNSKIKIQSNVKVLQTSDYNSYQIPVSSAFPTEVEITVTSGDGKTNKTYGIDITVGQNADLKSLTLSNGTLSPKFSPQNTVYDVSLDSAFDGENIFMNFSKADSNSVVKVDSNEKVLQISGGNSYQIPASLRFPTKVEITVTSKDGKATKTYEIVIRVGQNADLKDLYISGGTLSPSFSSFIANYSVILDSTFDEKNVYMGFSPADSNSVVKVESNVKITQTPRENSYLIPVSSLLKTEVTITITSKDGVVSRSYRVQITVASKSDATLYDIISDNGTVRTTGPVTKEVTTDGYVDIVKLTLVPSNPLATIITKIDNTNSRVGSTITVIFDNGKYSHSVLAEITAADGITKKTYTISVNRLALNDATLNSIQVDGKALAGFDGKNITNYTVELPSGTINVPTVTAVSTNPKANVAISPATSLPGTTILVVTAQDKVTTNTYNVRFIVREIVREIVYSTPVGVTGIIINQTTANLQVGPGATTSSIQLTATVSPNNATNQEITWTSSDIAVATVDQIGNVTAVGEGATTITAASVSNPQVTATAEVTVTDLTPVGVTEITLNQTTANLQVGQGAVINPMQLIATVFPNNATNQEITWTSSDIAVATVDQTGNITAVGEGATTIIAASVSNPQVVATAEVTVTDLTPVEV